jgi:hypothetical protein
MGNSNIANPEGDNSQALALAEAYTDKPIIRALVALTIGNIPFIGGAIDASIVASLEKMKEERLKVLFDELAEDEHYLTTEVIQQEDFIHGVVSICRAAVRTRNRNKIRQFAHLLLTATREKRLDSDQFEEYLAILDDLSPRELEILIILKRYEDAHPHQMIDLDGEDPRLENDLQRAIRFWQTFATEIETIYDLSPGVLESILTRLNRTGLYETFAGMYVGYSGGQGHITSRFMEFSKWIEVEDRKN